MSRKHDTRTTSRKNAGMYDLQEALIQNGKAYIEGPKRKMWTKHDLQPVFPLTPGQEDMFHAYINNYNICAYGSAGTGKSFLALYLALTDVLNPNIKVDRIIIVRSIVSTREIGHLPGKLCEKMAPHEVAYDDILYELFGKPSTYQDMKNAGLIEFHTTSFLRGLTWNNAMVVVDECQNMTIHEFDSVITRVGADSKLIVLGDVRQNDLINSRKEVSGFMDVIQILQIMKQFAMIQFLPADIVRSELVKDWIISRESLRLS